MDEDEQGAQGVVYRATCRRGVRIGDQAIAKWIPQKATEVDENEVRKLKQMFDEADEDASGDIDMHESFKVWRTVRVRRERWGSRSTGWASSSLSTPEYFPWQGGLVISVISL